MLKHLKNFSSFYNSQVWFIRERKHITIWTSFSHTKLADEYHTSENQDRLKLEWQKSIFSTFLRNPGKNSQQNRNKSNPTMYKKNSTSELNGVYSRYASLVQCSKINTHNTFYQQAKGKKKSHDHIHTWRKSIWQNPTWFKKKKTADFRGIFSMQ